MSMANGQSAQQTRSNPAQGSNPASSADLLKDIWKIIKPNSRKKNPSEDEVFEAIELMVENNKKAVDAGKQQKSLIEEAEKKARDKQRADDEKAIEKLKIAHVKEIDDLKAAHKKQIEELKASQPAPSAGEEPDLDGLTDAERQEYDDHVSKGAEELAAANLLVATGHKRKTARRFVKLF